MNTLNLSLARHNHLRAAALLALLTLGVAIAMPSMAQTPAAPATTAAAKAKPNADHPVVVQEDVLLFDVVPGTVYLNGGIGQNEQKQMRKDAHNWPLRMTFSDKSNDEFVAGVGVKVFNKAGKAVLRLKDGGPMTFVQVPPGEYRITALYKGEALSRMVHIGPKGADVNFHWLI